VYLVYEDERWTFGEVMAQVDGIASALVERYGVGKGDRVAIGMRNYPEWITSFAAITSIGAISVSLNAWWTEDELDYALGDSTPKVLIADKERVERGLRSCQERGIAILGVRLGDAAPRASTASRTCSCRGPRCPTSTSGRTTTPPSSTPRHDREPQGRGVDAPGGAQRALRLQLPLGGPDHPWR
jgi:acyl-CoA synthetase (AMP-forming)/AMP-acid ligase II